jgi:hypothetical protein
MTLKKHKEALLLAGELAITVDDLVNNYHTLEGVAFATKRTKEALHKYNTYIYEWTAQKRSEEKGRNR